VAITIGGVFAFWFGLRFAFQTDFPLLAVASGSMEPVFYRGDLIVVQGGLNFAELHAATKDAQPPGEIIVFYDPRYGRVPIYLPVAGQDTRLIVHRAISKIENDGTWYFQTQGDNNHNADSWSGPETLNGRISEKLVVGRVIGNAPWLGHIPLFMNEHYLLVTSVIVVLFVVLIVADFIFPKKESEKEEEQGEKTSNTT
jgi:signal peptidase